jgi:nucleotide-binding universal stress UspA family protein
MFQTILVPLDGSRFSLHALPYALDLAKRYQARVVLLRVVELSTPISGISAPIGLEAGVPDRVVVEEAVRLDKLNAQRARRYMKKKLHEVTSQGIEAVSHVVTGEPFDGIIKTCKKEKADLIVMTTHGKSGLKRAILGSVADKVIRESRMPVMVIRPTSRKR